MLEMPDNMYGIKRTHYCGPFRMNDIGTEVTVCGWVQKQRDLGSLAFCDLRDRSGILQLTADEDSPQEVRRALSSLRAEYVVCAKGVIRERDSKNPLLPTGDVELYPSEIRILSRSKTPPFAIEEGSAVNDMLRLKHRYLDLRRPDLQRNILMRHRAAKIARDYFDDNGFIEIETPMLTKSSPEGARDYLVPSRVHPGKFYALPQSPQLYKQLLMLSGFDRYMQIVRCFRDEDLRADRQPEFTQIDLEMSFVDADDVMTVNEGFIKRLFFELLGIELETPFPRLSYNEAMERFGSDKPDTRFGFELRDLTAIVKGCGFGVFAKAIDGGGSVRAINIKGYADRFSRKEIDSLSDFAKTYRAGGLAWLKVGANGEVQSPIAKFFTKEELDAILAAMEGEENDLILFGADRDQIVFDALGAVRCECARRLGILDPGDFKLLWVVDFPLFEYDEDNGRFVAKHHPFTAPKDEDVDIVDKDQAKARAKAYDIIINGVEVGGGSIRIHSPELQERMFAALGFTKERAMAQFGYLIEAFSYGAPPHGGMAYGLDRLVMLLCGCDSIRDTIAFPKVQNASELMTGAPSPVDEGQLLELKITAATPADPT